MATVQEFVQQINDLTAQMGKVKAESQATLQKVSDLEDKLNNSSNTVDPAILDAFAGLKAQVQSTDDLIPDVQPPADNNGAGSAEAAAGETNAGAGEAGTTQP